MKKLVRIQQPHDYYCRGRVIFINPDDVKTVKAGDRYETVIILHSNENYVTDTPMEDVVKSIEEAL